MTSLFHSGLSKDFSLMLNDADDYNVIIQVGENPNTKEFRAHSAILRARSPYFKSAFSADWVTKKDNMITFSKPNITPTVFSMILKFIYAGEVDLTSRSGEEILELLVASDELLIEELFNYIQETICADPQSFIISKDFPSDILHGLLKRDDLRIDEDVAWDCLIKWGIEQTPGLGENSDITKWNDENFEALKKTLERFIPLIRFVEIPPSEYFDKVRPYKPIIPNHICEEVEEFHFKGTLPKTTTLLPPRIGKSHIRSKIIKPRLVSIIINSIDKKDAMAMRNKNDPLYKFDLIYRGSQDGIDNSSFINKCRLRGQEPILVLVKCQNTIFGGYSSVGFYSDDEEGNDWFYSTDNFIFSFENDDLLKLSRVISHDFAIYNNFNGQYGFNFGDNALCMANQNLHASNGDNYYERNVNDSENFIIEKIEEIEAFKVIK